jgi:hypothetical protein
LVGLNSGESFFSGLKTMSFWLGMERFSDYFSGVSVKNSSKR